MKNVDPHEYGWALAQKVSKKEAHEPRPMRSGQSTGPIRMFICDTCYDYVLSTDTLVTPLCDGR